MRPQRLLRLLLILQLHLLCPASQAQYYFEKFTEENGLSDNRVTCFLKDKTGFLWIGTKNGLNRYDGTTFKIFRPSGGNSISNETISDIVQDSTGKIWVSTINGLNSYDPITDRWENMMPDLSDERKRGLPNNLIWDLEVDEDNQLWIVADVWELARYDQRTKTFRYYDWPTCKQQKIFEGFPGYRSIHKIKRKNKNEWWLATTIGLCSVDMHSGKIKVHAAYPAESIIDLYYDANNQKVFITNEHGKVLMYDEKHDLFKELQSISQPYPVTRWKKTEQTTPPILLAHRDGIAEIDPVNNTSTLISHQPALSPSLMPGGSYVIYKDRSGIVWVGTNRGINYFNSRNRSADFIPLTTVSINTNDDGMSAALYDTTEHKYYITSLYSKELFVIDDASGSISSIRTIGGKSLSACTNICLDRENQLWLLTATNVYRYDRATKKFNPFPTPNAGDVIFNEMLLDKYGNYWFATWRDGVYHYDTQSRKFYVFTWKDSISSKNITSLHNDPVEDAVWIGSYNHGPYRYDLKKQSFVNYSETPTSQLYLQMSLIKDIEMDAQKKLWFCSFGAGLFVYRNGKSYDESFSSISYRDGLPGSSYYCMTQDSKQRLWLLGRQGLTAIDQNGKHLFDAVKHPATNFANFAPGTSNIKRISFNAQKNEILVPVAGGLLIYYPDEVIPSTGFPIVLTDIGVNNTSVIQDSSVAARKKIEIPYRTSALSFQFAALDYSNRGHFQYEYKLDDGNAEWKSNGSSNALNFTHLSPGNYTFAVRARDQYGNLSSNTATFSFRILPPFWLTWWSISAFVLLLFYAIYRWVNYFRKKLKTQQILNYFATSLYGQNTTEEVFWDIAKNCVSQLKFADCVVYLYDPSRKVLIQKAAYGPKNPEKHEIYNAIDIPLGQGIVGAVAQTKKPEIIHDTSKDSRYIVDDQRRYSEITVPIIVDNELFGVIDSEHPRKRFFGKYHLYALQEIAAICSDKVTKYIIQEKLRSKISRDLHDEIGSSLTSINVLSKVALSKVGHDADITGYLSKIKDTTSQTMENMSDMVWAINPRNDKLDSMMSRMKEFAVDICEARGIELNFSSPGNLENVSLDLDKRKNLFLVFKEAVNNAVKYSGTDRLDILFEQNNGKLLMVVQDRGKGFDTSKVSSGNGLHNMQDRARECNGVLTIESMPQKGTKIELEMPSPELG